MYLLGFTHDLKGVVFGQRRGGKTAAFWVPIDESFMDAVVKLDKARDEAAEAKQSKKGAKGKAKGRPVPVPESKKRVVLPPVGRSQASSAIPASEIQQLLRQGRSVNSVVEVAKASRAWVERLFEPVLAERVGVVRLAQRAQMARPRLGRSGMQLGDAVLANLEERRATSDTIEGLDDAWDARAGSGGQWRVWVRFNHRGQKRTAEWRFRKDTRELTPRNRLAAQLGWWAPEPELAPASVEGAEGAEGSEEAEAKPRKTAKRRPATRRRRPAPKGRSRAKSGKKAPARRRAPKRRPAARRR